jgi:1,4-dihydroxy-2-naphthoate octaprenyltransferase
LGTATAAYLGYRVDWTLAALFASSIILIQLSGQVANEYADVNEDERNDNRTLFSGGTGVLTYGTVSRRLAGSIAIFLGASGLLMTALITAFYRVNLVIPLLSVLGLAGAYAYSLPPLRLSHTPFGTPLVTFMIGFMLPVASFIVQTGSWDWYVAVVTLPITLQVWVFSMAVELPDYETDLASGRRNMVTRLGRSWLYVVLTGVTAAGAMVTILGFVLDIPSPIALSMISIFLIESVVLASAQVRVVRHSHYQVLLALEAAFVLIMASLSSALLVGI